MQFYTTIAESSWQAIWDTKPQHVYKSSAKAPSFLQYRTGDAESDNCALIIATLATMVRMNSPDKHTYSRKRAYKNIISGDNLQ